MLDGAGQPIGDREIGLLGKLGEDFELGDVTDVMKGRAGAFTLRHRAQQQALQQVVQEAALPAAASRAEPAAAADCRPTAPPRSTPPPNPRQATPPLTWSSGPRCR